MMRCAFGAHVQWLLDVLICNAIGIHLGMWACRWLTVKQYRWEGFWNIAGLGYVDMCGDGSGGVRMH
jgi:hypothetical protein